MITNLIMHSYSQDQELTTALKKIPGVPLLYIILNTMVLDKPSASTLKHVEAVQLGEIVSSSQQKSIQSLKEKQGLAKDGEEKTGKKRKRKSNNPNPLSCLKKKKKPMQQQPKKTEGEKKKRSRHKKRKIAGGETVAVSQNPTTTA